MELNYKLSVGRVVKCFNSLLIDVKLSDDSIVPVFCASSEACAMCRPGMEVYLRYAADSLRKVKYELQFLLTKEGIIFVDSSLNHQLFSEAFNNKLISEFADYTVCREIDKNDRLLHVDFELSNEQGQKCYVFIENVFNKAGGYSVFPAGINFFELEMFEDLARLRAQGHKTVVFMIVPRNDCLEAKFSWNLDPVASAKIFDEAKNGLDFICYSCKVDKKSVTIANKMKILY